MRRRGVDALGARVEHRLRRPRASVPPLSMMSSTITAVLPFDVADHVADLGHLLGRALLRHQRQVRTELAPRTCVQLHAADVGRDDDEVVELQVGEVLREHEQRGRVVDRLGEEALDLPGVQVHGEHAVDAGRLEHVRHDPRADRLAQL